MAELGHPVDVVADDLARTYAAGAARLEALIRAGLARGLDGNRLGTLEQKRGDATQAYRERQLAAARAVLAELEREGRRGAPVIAHRAYASSIIALDRVVAPDSELARMAFAGRFGGIHQRAVSVLAGNLERSLDAAVAKSRANVEAVFARAAALEGALPPAGLPAAARFIGRREDDVWRRVALEVAGRGRVALETRRQLSAELVRRLLSEGVTDALTGFVDRAGRRWPLPVYAEMVMRTTTREAASRAVDERLGEHGIDLVAITHHDHHPDVCSDYDGRTFSRRGKTPGYPVLDRLPPFHPRCRHVLAPARGLLDAYERELGIVSKGDVPAVGPAEPRVPVEPPPPKHPVDTLPPARPPDPPFSSYAEPANSAGSDQRLEAQRVLGLIAQDPGPEPGQAEAWAERVDAQAKAANRALNKVLGPDLAKFIDRAWGRHAGVRKALLEGDMSVEEASELAAEEWHRLEHGRAVREYESRAIARGPVHCFVCGRFKRRPADVCEWCGDDPVPGVNFAGGGTHGGDYYEAAQRFNRSFGYED